jgi:hypothetical protein
MKDSLLGVWLEEWVMGCYLPLWHPNSAVKLVSDKQRRAIV